MIDILCLQLVNLVEFGGRVTQSRMLGIKDYEFTWEPESNTIVARHRETNRVRVIPMSNVIAWEPDVSKSMEVAQSFVEATVPTTDAQPVPARRGRPPKIRPAE